MLLCISLVLLIFYFSLKSNTFFLKSMFQTKFSTSFLSWRCHLEALRRLNGGCFVRDFVCLSASLWVLDEAGLFRVRCLFAVIFASARGDVQRWSRSCFCFGCNEARQRWHVHRVNFLGGQDLLQVHGGMSGSLADVHRGKSELLIVPCGKLGNDDVRWAPSGVLGPSLMFTIGS